MKDAQYNGYTLSAKRKKLQKEQIMALMAQTYWGNKRTWKTMRKAIAHTLPVGVYDPEGKQVGFCRVLTDGATTYCLADVIISEEARGKGLGVAMVDYALKRKRIKDCMGLLITEHAHGLYEKFGFRRVGERLMLRPSPAKLAEERQMADNPSQA